MTRDRFRRNNNNRFKNKSNNGPLGAPKGKPTGQNESVRPVQRGGAEGQELFSRYEKLFEELAKVRSDYFEKFFRVDDNRKRSMEKRYYDLLNNFRNFENSLPDWQKNKFLKDHKGNRLDLDYSLAHPDAEVSNEEQVAPADPHVSLIQKGRPSYKDDKEESVGTMEDYNRVKGL